MAETKTHAENADLPNPPTPEREEVANEVKNALLTKIRERVETLSEAHSKEINIATRYELRIRADELIALFNELANFQL